MADADAWPLVVLDAMVWGTCSSCLGRNQAQVNAIPHVQHLGAEIHICDSCLHNLPSLEDSKTCPGLRLSGIMTVVRQLQQQVVT